MDSTDKAQEAIKALNPLCTLRYSATHRNPYNLVYRLDPVRAFEMRLVKQIVVASAAAEGAANDAFVRVEQIDYKKGIKAKLRIHVQSAEDQRRRPLRSQQGADLFARACEQRLRDCRDQRRAGQRIPTFLERSFRLGEEVGGLREDVWRVQIKHTVKKHLGRSCKDAGRRPCPVFHRPRCELSLRADGQPVKGKLATAFERSRKITSAIGN